MTKTYKLLIGICSLLVAIYLAFNTFSISQFIGFTILFGVLIFAIGILVVKLIKNIAAKSIKKSVISTVFILGLLILIGFFSGGIFMSGIITGLPHFRTNIFTEKCDINFYDTADYWYYRYGCTLPKDEKVKILKTSDFFTRITGMCKNSPADTSVFGSRYNEIKCLDFIK